MKDIKHIDIVDMVALIKYTVNRSHLHRITHIIFNMC